MYSRPARVASRFRLSSLSPCDLTCPHRANVVDVVSARPSALTSAMLICTEAWSFEVMSRSMRNNFYQTNIQSDGNGTHWWPRICGGRRGQQECPDVRCVSVYISLARYHRPDRSPCWFFDMLREIRVGEWVLNCTVDCLVFIFIWQIYGHSTIPGLKPLGKTCRTFILILVVLMYSSYACQFGSLTLSERK